MDREGPAEAAAQAVAAQAVGGPVAEAQADGVQAVAAPAVAATVAGRSGPVSIRTGHSKFGASPA